MKRNNPRARPLDPSTYTLQDKATLRKTFWQYIVVDEGHRMKNSQSKFAQTLGTAYQSRNRLLLTGTPLQVCVWVGGWGGGCFFCSLGKAQSPLWLCIIYCIIWDEERNDARVWRGACPAVVFARSQVTGWRVLTVLCFHFLLAARGWACFACDGK